MTSIQFMMTETIIFPPYNLRPYSVEVN